MRIRPACFHLALLICSSVAGFPGAPSSVVSRPWATRFFHSTPHGQIHVTKGGNFSSGTPTLVLFHGHPRSSAEFVYMLDELVDRHSFVAFDYFGLGHSDDCLSCTPQNGEVVSIKTFAGYAREVLASLQINAYVPVGNLKGTSIAQQLAAADPSAAKAVVLITPLYLLPDAAAKVRSYMSKIEHPQLQANGSHLLNAWADPSDSPIPDLFKMEEKTVDELRALFTGWQYVLSELNDNNSTLDTLSKITSPTLLVWGSAALAQLDAFGFHSKEYKALVEQHLVHKTSKMIDGGPQAMIVTNTSLVAKWVDEFIKHPHHATVGT